MNTNNVREAVQIVLDRIESHPEDFEWGGRLHWVVKMLDATQANKVNDLPLSRGETDAIHVALRESRYKQFHAKVLQSLLEEAPSAMDEMTVQGRSVKPKIRLQSTQFEYAKAIAGMSPSDLAEANRLINLLDNYSQTTK